MAYLKREDIVGKRIGRVIQTPWRLYVDVFVCRVFVELENGGTFELRYQDSFKEPPIELVDLEYVEFVSAELRGDRESCIGDSIVEVLASYCWPSLGVLLASGRFLFCSDCCWPLHVGACLTRVGDFYELEDVVTYWGHAEVHWVPGQV